MTVDSEAIFALVDEYGLSRDAFEELTRLDGDGVVRRAPGRHRCSSPAASAGRCGSARASTRRSSRRRRTRSRSRERYLGLKLKKRELPEGIVVALEHGKRGPATRFNPDRAFEEDSLPAVRAPHEGAICLRRLAAIAASL